MIYQLPNGRIIHMTLEQYLDLTDEELHELASLGDNFTSEVSDPFFQSVLKSNSKSKVDKIVHKTNESEPGLDEVTEFGFIRLQQDTTTIGTNNWLKAQSRSTLVHGKVEELEASFSGIDHLPGQLIIREQITAFNNTDPDRDLKM